MDANKYTDCIGRGVEIIFIIKNCFASISVKSIQLIRYLIQKWDFRCRIKIKLGFYWQFQEEMILVMTNIIYFFKLGHEINIT